MIVAMLIWLWSTAILVDMAYRNGAVQKSSRKERGGIGMMNKNSIQKNKESKREGCVLSSWDVVIGNDCDIVGFSVPEARFLR